MNEIEVMERIKDLAETIDWRNKKILYFVSNVYEATIFLSTVNLFQTNIKMVRDRELSMFCNYIFINEKIYPVEVICENDLDWADEIVVMCGEYITQKFLGKYAKECVWKIKRYDNPFVLLQKKYRNQYNTLFEIWDKIEHRKEKKDAISGNDIPFIEEPIIKKINQNQVNSYVTYSIGKKTLIGGLYFDEREITEIKKYADYNRNTKVIVYGDKAYIKGFTEDSIQIYKAIYGDENVACISNWKDYLMEDDQDYIFIDARLRIVSPFITKYFKSLRKKSAKYDSVGLVSPPRIYCPQEVKILWGNKEAVTLWKEKSMYFSDDDFWNQYIMSECLVADREIFNLMDVECPYMDCENKEKRIGYVEWMMNRM